MSDLPAKKPLPWLARAAMFWVDMERGLFDWGERKQPMNRDGSYRVLKGSILEACGLSRTYGGATRANELIWQNPVFLKMVADERARRDHAMQDVVQEIEAIKGPLMEMGDRIIDKVSAIFDKEPDDDDPTALSPAQYVKLGREWFHEALEVEGKIGSAKQQGIESVLATLAQNNQVTSTVVDQALTLVKEYRSLQDRKMGTFIEGELVE